MRRLIRDTSALYVLYAFKLLSPLGIPALLAHQLSRDELGQFAICVSIASTVSIGIELGFGLSATRAAAGRSSRRQRRILDAVTSARAAAALVALPLCLAATALILGRRDPGVLVLGALTWATAACAGFSQLWFFQANGALPVLAALEAVGVTGALVALWRFAHTLPAALAGNLLMTFIPLATTSAVVFVRMGGVRISAVSAWYGWRVTKEMAKFRALTTSYTTAIPAVLGILLPPASVAPFFVAERFVRALTAGFIPVTQIAFPRMCALRGQDPRRHELIVKWMLATGAVLALALAVLVALVSDRVSILLGPARIAGDVARYLNQLVWMVPFLAVSTVLGNLFMLPRGEDRSFNRVILWSAAAGFALLWTLPNRLGASGGAAAIVAAELVAAGAMFRFYREAVRNEA